MQKITLLSSLFLIIGLNANNISSNSTRHQYSKPGASIEMDYKSKKVEIDESSDINITLSTPLRRGTISVDMTLDKNLIPLSPISKNLNFFIEENRQSFNINFKVKSKKQGLYYIRLLTKVDKGYGTKLRSFAVPVYIGKESKIIKKSIDLQMKALESGENISISKAIETVKAVKPTH